MMLTAFVIPLPFYCWPGLSLLFDPSGFQPMFYIIGFTLALGWVSSSYRDKPWLLVLGSTAVLMGSILAVLYVLQQANIYDGWDVLFTGGSISPRIKYSELLERLRHPAEAFYSHLMGQSFH